MKKILSLCLCVVLCFTFSACVSNNELNSSDLGSNNEVQSSEADSNESTITLLLEKENVKISFSGISSDVGIGEGIYLLVENSRSESIIVNIAEVSLNDSMQAVIQPQMPLHLTSPGKKSNQPYVFSGVKDFGSTVNTFALG